MKKNTLLLVTYYWPPAGGPGVQRPYYFAKYLLELGWNIIVYTVENNQQLGKDDSFPELDIELYQANPWIPGQSSGHSFSENKGFFKKFKNWIRGNLLLPDSKISWLFVSNSILKNIFKQHEIDIALVTGPPQTTHLIGKKIRRNYDCPVVHDFRDPWSKAFFLKDFHRFAFIQKYDEKLETSCVKSADGLLTVSAGLSKLFSRSKDFQIIPNGFDFEIKSAKKQKQRSILYAGTLSQSQIPDQFIIWLKSNNEFKLTIYGNVHSDLYSLVEKHGLNSQVNVFDSIPHNKLELVYDDHDYFLLLIPQINNNEGILTGKLFEYLGSNRPILGFGPVNGDASMILNQCNAGKMISYEHREEDLDDFFRTEYIPDIEQIKSYHRRELSKKLSDYLKTFITD